MKQEVEMSESGQICIVAIIQIKMSFAVWIMFPFWQMMVLWSGFQFINAIYFFRTKSELHTAGVDILPNKLAYMKYFRGVKNK